MPPRKPGRPPRAVKASLERIEIRATKAEKRTWERAASAADLTLSDWLRRCANKMLGETP